MRFLISLHSMSCSGLLCSDRSSYRPYLRFNFDGYKKSSTRPLHFPSEHTRNDVSYPDSFSFTYETHYPLKLHQKALSIKAYSRNAILADDLIGQTALDLHTLATGPCKQSLALLTPKGQHAGRVHFVCEMQQHCSVTLHIKSAALSTLPVLNKKTPISHLTYGLTTLEAKKRYKTDKQSNTINPVFPVFQPLKLSGPLHSFWREGVEFHVMVKARSRDTSHKMGAVTMRLSDHHAFKDQQPLSVVERVAVTPEYIGVQCVMRVHCYYEGMPSFVQMVGGLHDERGVHDATPFAEGLPLPRVSFFETRMPPAPPAGAAAPPPQPSSVSVVVKAAEGQCVRRRGEREGSVMSQKAAREYDGASIMRRDYDEDDEGPPSPVRPERVPRASSSLGGAIGADSTAASLPSSRAMSRSSSSGHLAASSTPVKRPTTPSSQKRYLAYPPPPPPKPDTKPVRVSLRALSISSPADRSVDRERRGSVGEEREASPRSPSAGAGEVVNYAPVEEASAYAPEPGKFGFCSMCSRPAGLLCTQVMLPVCSYSCRMKCLQAHGLPVDDEKERPPPLNPEAAQPSPSHATTTSASLSSSSPSYPALAASPMARQPGPAGFCVVCQYPALFVCKDTLVPVCSAECKAVNLRLNPHLQGGGGRIVEPSAPSRTLLFGAAVPLPSPPPPRPSMESAPLCVVCGDVSEFRCSVTDAAVCSKECKAVNLKLRQRAAAAQQPPQPQLRPCPTCTYNNSAAAAACEICSTPLLAIPSSYAAAEPPSPLAPSFHLQHPPPRPAVPKRPSFAPVIGSPVATAPGGPPQRR